MARRQPSFVVVDAKIRADRIRDAIVPLKRARTALREACAYRAADYVQRAIKSVEGALRHAQGRAGR